MMKFNPSEIIKRDFDSEFSFKTSRSSGPGGQNVNKVETRVSLKFNLKDSELLNEQERQRLYTKWNNRLNTDDELVLHSETHRSQLRNKEEAIKKFYNELKKAFTDPKPRKKTKPSKGAIQERLKAKKKHADKKANRRKPDY